MARVRTRGEEIRRYILDNMGAHRSDIGRITAEHFHITRQAVNKHLQRLVKEGSISKTGETRSRSYDPSTDTVWNNLYLISKDTAEDVIWRNDIKNVLAQQPDNVLEIWQHGFTEMFNNAIDHSGGSQIFVGIKKTAVDTEMFIMDDGIGIFKKIQSELGLLDERHAILELSKGKLTTDPRNHTGEGIFFTSRMFDSFNILSGGVFFSHDFGKQEDWILERKKFETGTSVTMKLNNHTSRTTEKIYKEFSAKEDDYGFTKTIVPVRLAQYGNDKLISRSQAKRLLARVELFKVVIFNFAEVETIGKAFADEIFRVFPKDHPEIEIYYSHANQDVERTIIAARSGEMNGTQ